MSIDSKKSEGGRTIAVDLDGVIAQYDHWRGIEYFGEPNEEVVAELEAEKSQGTRIIIHTCRVNHNLNPEHTLNEAVALVEAWLNKHKIPYDEVWAKVGKPVAHEYWDDRAVKKP